jgi:hypothetical protein
MNRNEKSANVIDLATKKRINAEVRTTMSSLEQQRAVAADTPNSRLQRLLMIYNGLKPLLVFLSTFGLLPRPWRKGIEALIAGLESLTAIGPEVVLRFKAGRDLEEKPAA